MCEPACVPMTIFIIHKNENQIPRDRSLSSVAYIHRPKTWTNAGTLRIYMYKILQQCIYDALCIVPIRTDYIELNK